MGAKQAMGHILDEAMRLPADARAALAGRLIESLDDASVDEGAEAAWAKEIGRRVRDIESGKVTTVTWAEARKRILSADGPAMCMEPAVSS